MQAGFFTHGLGPHEFELPHPPLGLPVILVIRQVLVRAFAILRSREDQPLVGAAEDEVTIALRDVLENVLRQSGEVAGFNRDTFGKVERQYRVTNFDGASISKEPDMRFTIPDASRDKVISTEDGLAVECKPVDKKHPPGTHYCDRGMQRFVDGDYAWATQEALMIGFVSDGRTIAGNLLPVMERKASSEKLGTIELPVVVGEQESRRDSVDEVLRSSVHERSFHWRGDRGKATPITLYHSWHRCD